MNKSRFEALLSKFHQAKVAVLGDFFLDYYIHLDRSLSEFSLETHKEAFQAVEVHGQPGAAGVVTNNLATLGAECAAIAVVGKDGHGYTLRQALKNRHVNTEYLIESKDRFTPTYTKPIMKELDGSFVELNRIDIINRLPNRHTLNQALAEKLQTALAAYDGVLVVEQVQKDGYGTMSPLLRDILSTSAENHPEKVVIVDSRHFAATYRNLSLKMNLSEAARAVASLPGINTEIDTSYQNTAAEKCADFLWEHNQKPVFITLGASGICGVAEGDFFHIRGVQLEGPIDIVGAGDSVLAGIGLALCVGASAYEAAFIGNLVGSITVQQIGTTGIATPDDLRQRFHEFQNQIKG